MKTDKSEPGNVVPTAVIANRTLVFAGIVAAPPICVSVAATEVLPAGIVSDSQAVAPA
jgi:hypothetical protein